MSEIRKPQWVRLGREISRLRELAGLTQAQLADATGWSRSLISALQRGTRTPKREQVEALDDALATGGALLRLWANLVQNLDAPAWITEVVRSEEQSTEIRMYHLSLVPGVLQTEDYARVVFTYGNPLDRSETIERLVAGRLKRREVLMARGGPSLWAVIDEAVIRRTVGDPQVMSGQLALLIDLAESQAVRLQVVPDNTPLHPGRSGPFRLLTFPDTAPLVYAEHAAGGELIDDHQEVRRFTAIFGELQGWALTPTQSLRLIREVKEEFDAR